MNYLWRLDSFDTEVFGFKVAKIISITPHRSFIELNKRIKNLIEDLAKNKVKYATYRVQSNNFAIIHALEKSGFILVDGLISLEISDLDNLYKEIVVREIGEANKTDITQLKNLASELFLQNRIFNDPYIPKNKAKEFYAKWIENSILGKAADSVLIWKEKGKILGYITLQRKGQIPLVGVSPIARGKGIAKNLVEYSFNKFKEWGLTTVVIETQMQNIPALRLYQSCGFKIVNSFLTLRWTIDD